MKSGKVVPEDLIRSRRRSVLSGMLKKSSTLLFGANRRVPTKSILKDANQPKFLRKSDPKGAVRFKDECKNDHPFLSAFAHGKRLVKTWKSIIFVALSYEVWAFPFRLAFNDPSVSTFIFMLDMASDSLFFIDIMVQLFESLDTVLKQNDDPTVESQLILKTISNHLTRQGGNLFVCVGTYYPGTVLTSRVLAPFDGVINLNIDYYHWLWWLSTIPRMVARGHRLYKSFNTASNDLSDSIHAEDGKNIAMLILLSAHCIGCFYFFISRLRGLDRRTWVSNIEDTLNVYARFESSLWQHYLLALFKGFSSISGIEFTPYLANNLEEQLLGIVMILVQVYISALILGTIIHFLAIRDPLAEQAAQRVKDLLEYIHMYHIPAELEAKLLKGLDFQHRKMMIDNIDADLQLSQSLQSKVMQSKYSSLLQKGKVKGQIFHGCNERFLHEMLVEFNVMYLMAAQEIFKKGDISREMLIVIDGSADVLNESGEVIAIITSDSPDVLPCIGEVAFFLGIMQPYSIRANKQADVRVVALSREDSKALFKKYPDQLELISHNILRAHGLAVDGSYVSDGGSLGEDDSSRAATRDELHATIVRRREESFAALIMAVKASELDDVLRLWLGGMETIKDYDGRTLLSYAAVAGAYKVVEYLIEIKAEVNERNRWGLTPLDEAMAARQQSTVQLLFQNHGRMGTDAMSTTLIEAASLGTLEKSYDSEQLFRIMRQSHVDPDIGDYDGRTALHLACANGFMKTADLLINLKANVNISDRWGGTPLKDAVASNQIGVAMFLRSKGATMPAASATYTFCEAASKGSVVTLKMLHGCDVVDLECKDYDQRNALHIAAAEGRLLAVAYLLSKSISPQLKDRWGGTALDNSLVGKTPYHMYCSKLIHSMGGDVSLLKGTEECARALEELEQIQISDVRTLLRRLNRAGYNNIVPKPVVDSEMKLSLECCFVHLPLVEIMRSTFHEYQSQCTDTLSAMRNTASKLKDITMPICKLLDAHPFLRQKKKPVFIADAQPIGVNPPEQTPAQLLEDEFASLDTMQSSVVKFDYYTGSRRYLISKLSRIIVDAMADGNIDEEEQQQIDLAWNELTMTGDDTSLQGIDALDSDDEAELYADVDNIMTEREYCDEHGFERTLYKVSKFRTAALRVSEMEAMYAKLCHLFWMAKRKGSEATQDSEPPIRYQDLISFFTMISETTMHHTPSFEIEGMFDAAHAFMRRDGGRERSRSISHVADSDMDAAHGSEDHVTLRCLVAGSEDFRNSILTLPIDENFGLLTSKTKVSEIIPLDVLRELCRSASVRNAGKGEVLLDHGHDLDALSLDKDSVGEAPKMWSIIVSGSLTLSKKSNLSNSEDSEEKFLGSSNIFGGYAHLRGVKCPGFTIKSNSTCQLVQFPVETLMNLCNKNPNVAERLIDEMAEGIPGHSDFRTNSSESRKTSLFDSKASFSSLSASFIASLGKNLNDLDVSTHSVSSHSPSVGTLRGRVSFQQKTEAVGSATMLNSTAVNGAGNVQTCEGQHHISLNTGVPTSDLFAIRSGFKGILEVWKSLSEGESTISEHVLHNVQENLGEVGSGVFAKLFLPARNDENYDNTQELEMFHNVEASEFWASWMQLLADRKSFETPGAAQVRRRSSQEVIPVEVVAVDDVGESDKVEEEVGLWEALHSRFAPGRRLRRKYLQKEVIESGIYEEVFAKVTGSLNNPLQHRDVQTFVKTLFPRHPYRISAVNAREFIDLFGKNGLDKGEISWPDIRKVLRPSLSAQQDGIFIGTVLHPNSWLMQWFGSFAKLLAAYHFTSVPFQLCFYEGEGSMYDLFSMDLFLPADVLTFIYLVIRLNTGYKSVRRNVWVTNRWKIASKVGGLAMLPALPIDWAAFALGVSYEACLWIRMSKLLMPYQLLTSGTNLTTQISNMGRFKYQVIASCAVIHICSCFWFFISKKYALWDPANPFSWFKFNYAHDDPSYMPNHPMHTNEYQYAGLSCEETKTAQCKEGETWYYYGMEVEDGMLARYMISLYVACTRIANQALIGAIVPENFVEVCYSIGFMILNLTVFRYVIGDLSTSVIESDEGRVSARAQAMKIFLFISRNNFSPELAEEITTYCDNSNSSASALSKSSKILRGLPHSLQVEVASHVCRDQLDYVSLFAGCSENFKNLVSLTVTTRAFSSEEYLFRRGEVSSDIFIVQSGHVELLIEAENTITGERVDSVNGPGKVLAEVTFFFELRHVVSARASRGGGAACLQIGRENFIQLLKNYPADEEIVTENAIKAVAVVKQGTSVVSFLSEGNLASLGGGGSRSVCSDLSKGRRGASRSNLDNILHIQRNHKMMTKLLMFSASKADDTPRVQWCLKGGHVSVNDVDQFGRSILHVAACEGHSKLVEYLLHVSANVDLRDHRGNTPLNDAVFWRHDDIALLIRQHAPGTLLSFEGFTDGVQLCEAAAAGNLQQITRLIENGVVVNAHDYDKRTALHLAACEGKLDVVKYLLSAQANVGFLDRFGNTALDDAIRHSNRSVQIALHGAGARVGGMNNILMACAASAKADSDAIDLIKNLVKVGLDPRAGDYDDRTPLHLAACSGKLGLLEYFLSYSMTKLGHDEHTCGELFNVCDRYGFTPLDDAHRHGHAPAVVLLERAGALRKDDPALAMSLQQQRANADSEAKAKVRAEALKRMSTSPETEAWASVDGTVLPNLAEFFKNLITAQQAILDLAQLILPAVRNMLKRYIREVLPQEMSIIEAKSFRQRGSVNFLMAAVRRQSSMSKIPPPIALTPALKGKTAASSQHSAAETATAADPSDGITLEAAMNDILGRIGEFLRSDCAAAKETVRIDFARCKILRLAAMPLSKELKALSLQIRYNAGVLKIIRKVLKEVMSVCLSFKDERTLLRPKPASLAVPLSSPALRTISAALQTGPASRPTSPMKGSSASSAVAGAVDEPIPGTVEPSAPPAPPTLSRRSTLHLGGLRAAVRQQTAPPSQKEGELVAVVADAGLASAAPDQDAAALTAPVSARKLSDTDQLGLPTHEP